MRTPPAYRPTPVEVWGPAFRWLEDERLTARTIFAVADGDGNRRCRLCELDFTAGERVLEQHAREHRRERVEWRARRERELRRENTNRLRALHREKKLTERVLGGET